MSKYAIEQQTLSEIGGAIRDLKKTSEPIMVKNFAEEIRSVIPVEPEYPNPPDDGKSRFYIHLEKPMEVRIGDNYGSSLQFRKIEGSEEEEASVSIDWGDGSEIEYIYTSEDTPCPYINLTHTYLESGDYIITMELSQNGEINSYGNFFHPNGYSKPSHQDAHINASILKYCILSNLRFYGGSYFFANLMNLEYCKICKSVTITSSNDIFSFKGCINLKKVEIEEGFMEGQDYPVINTPWFGGCINLKTITFPASIKYSTGTSSAMYKDCGLKEVIYAEGTIIPVPMPLEYPSSSSDYNPSITKAVLPDSIEEIPTSMFSYNSMLSEVTIPQNCQKIGSLAFHSTAIKEAIIPDTVNEIGHLAFGNCVEMKTIKFPSNPNFTEIPSSMLDRNFSLTNIEVPLQIVSIGDDAFSNTSIKTIDLSLHTNITNLGSGVFSSCDSLTEIKLPPNITELKDSLLSSTAISSIEIPENVVTLGASVFTHCENLTSINIPDGVTEIPNGFASYSGLTSITFPSNLQTISDYAFSDTLLSELIIPDTVNTIGNSAFSRCSELRTVSLPKNSNFTTISSSLFGDCSNLSNIEIPSQITSIGKYAFSGTSIESIEIPLQVTSIGSNAFSATKLTAMDLSLHDSLTTLGSDIFSYCSNLTEVKLPPNLTELQARSFLSTPIKSITIPSSVTKIGFKVFTPSSEMTEKIIDIHFTSEMPPTFENSPFDGYDTVNIYVPQSAVEAYKAVGQLSPYVDNIIGE